MNLQQSVQPRSSSVNGFSRHRVEKDNSSRMENKFLPGKSNHPSRVMSAGIMSSGKGGGPESPSRDRLEYFTTCLIGYHVEVQVTNGSVFSGIFHATDADQGFGVVLKMARLTKDLSSGGQKHSSDSVCKPPLKTLIVAAHELVQIVAKDVAVTSDGVSSEFHSEQQRDIMLDSNISQSHCVGVERELERWMPDEDDRQHPELENIFDSPWTGSWDQFKVNEALFGVKSTFNEELYTTKLERGPKMRDLEEEAWRIAREIEGEETRDLHLAEERGTFPHVNEDIDEETKYSSVYRGVDDSGYEDEDVMLYSCDTETFGNSARPAFGRSFADVTSGKNYEGSTPWSLSQDENQLAAFNANKELHLSGSLTSYHNSMGGHGFEDDSRVQENQMDEQEENTSIKETVSTKSLSEEVQATDDLQSMVVGKRDGSEKAGLSSVASTYSIVSAEGEANISSHEFLEDPPERVYEAGEPVNSCVQSGSSAPSTSQSGVATSSANVPTLSPSSSIGSMSSEKSTLNPNAKEFKFNPNAKSFVPSQSPLRPTSPVNDGSFYFPNSMPTVPHMHGMPVGIGVTPFGPQPVFFNPQASAMQSPGAYFPANGPQYGQQMILGHPRQVMYMSGYPTEMQYNG